MHCTKFLTCGLVWLSFLGLPAAADDSKDVAPPRAVPFFEGLGSHRRAVATNSPEAQRFFDQGLSFVFAFNHDEAIRSFEKAAVLDPECAMAWWGIALANGPHINNPVVPEQRARAAYAAVQRARSASRVRPSDRALIEAQAARYSDPPASDRTALDAAYANAMRSVWRLQSDDGDIGALFAESLMDLRPWDLWTPEGKPQPGTDEVLATLEAVLAKHPSHPLALHLYIHAVEASPHPERADAAADRLRDLQPGLGHMVHMPSHIDVRRGRWAQAFDANVKAMEADRKYRELSPQQGFYRIYMSHNHHMLAFAAMMVGRSAPALQAIDAMVAQIPDSLPADLRALVDGYIAMPLEVRMRFGRWQEVLAAAEPPEHFPISRALRHYARGVAHAALGDPLAARDELAQFEEARKRVPADRTFGNNAAHDLLAVAQPLLEGEILYREGKAKPAIAALRQAIVAEDKLRYDEPPDWIQPTRHALGAVLLREKRYQEAETVFREDLARLPDNGWALLGLAQSLRGQNKPESDRVQERFATIWATADVTITSPCACQQTH